MKLVVTALAAPAAQLHPLCSGFANPCLAAVRERRREKTTMSPLSPPLYHSPSLSYLSLLVLLPSHFLFLGMFDHTQVLIVCPCSPL